MVSNRYIQHRRLQPVDITGVSSSCIFVLILSVFHKDRPEALVCHRQGKNPLSCPHVAKEAVAVKDQSCGPSEVSTVPARFSVLALFGFFVATCLYLFALFLCGFVYIVLTFCCYLFVFVCVDSDDFYTSCVSLLTLL